MDIWNDPEPSMEVFRELRRSGFFGVRIWGPGQVDLESRDRIPLVLYPFGTYRQIAEARYLDRAALVLVRTDRWSVSALHAETRRDEMVFDEEEEVDLESVQDGWTATTHVLDLRTDVGLPWEESSYLATVLLGGTVSERVGFCLGPGEVPQPDDAPLEVSIDGTVIRGKGCGENSSVVLVGARVAAPRTLEVEVHNGAFTCDLPAIRGNTYVYVFSDRMMGGPVMVDKA